MEKTKISLRACRVNAGYSIKEAAEKLGISRHTIQNWENKRTFPTVDHVEKICKLYDVDYNNIQF